MWPKLMYADVLETTLLGSPHDIILLISILQWTAPCKFTRAEYVICINPLSKWILNHFDNWKKTLLAKKATGRLAIAVLTNLFSFWGSWLVRWHSLWWWKRALYRQGTLTSLVQLHYEWWFWYHLKIKQNINICHQKCTSYRGLCAFQTKGCNT